MLTQSILDGPMRASWAEVAATTRRVQEVVAAARALTVTCPFGTDFRVGVGRRELIHEDTGLLRHRGALGNLPAGEAYFVPEAESAEGVLVFRSGPDRPVVEPTEVVVERGKVSYCPRETPYSRFLEAKFDRDYKMRHVAELGIGTNPLARDVGSMIEGEKIQGTAHVALGDDKAMGGDNEATEHWDHVLEHVSVGAEMKGGGSTVQLIENGRLLVV
jgi:leucyl aminopeptidase (aminopeptidase T)